MNTGILTISLDFELHWGGFEKWPLRDYENYFLNTRKVIPEMLRLFEKYEVHVTWAAVGMLFASNRKELHAYEPSVKPAYRDQKLSAYNYISQHGIGEDELADPYHYAPSLVERIIGTPNQEIGTHTFAHIYCNEEGQTPDAFRSDLQSAQRIAKKFGCGLRSLVFPRNQFNDRYLRICFEEGIRAVRSNPVDWFWKIDSTQNESLWKRFNRGADAYFNVGSKNTFSTASVEVREGLPLCIPASRLLRPYSPKELFLNKLKIRRINSEMRQAARNNECYHLWWHPHNFGRYPDESIGALEMILKHYAYCREHWRMRSMSMGELAATITHGK